MKRNCISVLVLPIVLGIALAVCAVIRTFVPMAVLPKLDLPNMVLISLISLLLSHYLKKGNGIGLISALILAALSFGLLPVAVGFASGREALKLVIAGGVVYTALAWLFGQLMQWLSTGTGSRAAPALTALGLYLAAQCFYGILL